MGKQFQELKKSHIDFITDQHLFFVATAATSGNINISPKGMNTLKVLNSRHIIWLNLTGSGNETFAHVRENQRMTLMWCSFSKDPKIIRAYGRAVCYHPGEEFWKEHIDIFSDYRSVRQLFQFQIDMVRESCGYGVPIYEYTGERENPGKWSSKKINPG